MSLARRGGRRGFRGRGRGFWGRGYRDPYYMPTPYSNYPQPSKEQEKAYLEDMIKGLEEEIKMIKERLQELSKEKKDASQ